jgi:hypothetical protein
MSEGDGTLTVGQVVMDGTAKQIGGATPSPLPRNVTAVNIRCHKANTGPIYLGLSNAVTVANGYEIPPGESQRFAIINPGKLWVIGTNLEKYSWATEGA